METKTKARNGKTKKTPGAPSRRRPKPKSAPRATRLTPAKRSPGNQLAEWSNPQTISVKHCEPHPKNRTPAKHDVAARAASIKKHGQLEPILIRKIGVDKYQIISGETRWRAVRKNGSPTVIVRIGKNIDDRLALILVTEANAQRSDLNPIERAELLDELCKSVDDGGAGLTHEQAGDAIAGNNKSPMSRATVSNALRLLKLPKKIRDVIADGQLPATYAREVAALLDGPTKSKTESLILKTLKGKTPLAERYSRDEWRNEITRNIIIDSRSMVYDTNPDAYYLENNPVGSHRKRYFKPTADQLEKLQPFEIKPRHGSKHSRTLNVKLWNQLQKTAAKERLAAKKSGTKKKASKNGKPAPPTAAELKAKAAERKRVFKKRINDWQILWRRWWLVGAIQSNSPAVARLLMYVAYYQRDQFSGAVERALENMKLPKSKSYSGIWKNLLTGMPRFEPGTKSQPTNRPDKFSEQVAVEILYPGEKWFMQLDEQVVFDLATEYGFRPADAWKRLVETNNGTAWALRIKFFEIYGKDDLAKLAKTIGVSSARLVSEAKTKSELAGAMAKTNGKLPPSLK